YRARVRLAEAELAGLLGDRARAATLAAEAGSALRAGGWLAPLAWAVLRQADFADENAVPRLLADAETLVARLDVPQLWHALELRVARLRRREGRVAEAEQLLRRAVARIDALGEHLPDHVLRTAFRADTAAARDELTDLLITRGGPADAEDACLISDAGKSRTLGDLVTGTVGVPACDADAEILRCQADLGAVYTTLLDGGAASRVPLLRRRADDLARRLGMLRLRRSVTR